MADILQYLDSINIDVAKRKYYNVNKVNAVLEDLRGMAVELVDENERQRQELETLREELGRQQTDGQQSQELFHSMQELYRETLSKAHHRADTMVQEAEARSESLLQEVEHRSADAAKQVSDCFTVLRQREEETIRFLQDRLQQVLQTLNGAELTPGAGEGIYTNTIPEPVAAGPAETGEAAAEDGVLALQDLQNQIRRLAEEINALESGM